MVALCPLCQDDSFSMSDICDGSVFRFLADTDNFLSDKNNLALALSTDAFKSSKLSLWPVYLTILNLPVQRAHILFFVAFGLVLMDH